MSDSSDVMLAHIQERIKRLSEQVDEPWMRPFTQVRLNELDMLLQGAGMSELMHEIETVDQLLNQWDSGGTIWSIEMGGLGPGYEQAIQIAAVEFARAGKDLPNIKHGDKESTERFTKCCDEVLHKYDEQLGGLSGAQFGAARWLAFQWCFNGGPAAVSKRHKDAGQGERCMQVSKHFPVAPSPTVADLPNLPTGLSEERF